MYFACAVNSHKEMFSFFIFFSHQVICPCMLLCVQKSRNPDWDILYEKQKILWRSTNPIKSPLLALPYGKPKLQGERGAWLNKWVWFDGRQCDAVVTIIHSDKLSRLAVATIWSDLSKTDLIPFFERIVNAVQFKPHHM